MRELGALLPVVENEVPVHLCEVDLESASTELHGTIICPYERASVH